MTSMFRSRIKASLADSNLQSALDANAERRILVRQAAFASLKDPQSLRMQAHRVRADVIEHLDSYLEQFIEQATKNGMHIHHAENAVDAVQIVLEIATKQGARLIAKSKTMVSEEIGLNHALEKAGLKVVETDLGEYIVQLRGETPSHIITPAVHLRRQDVGKLFEQKLGLPYTEDIGTMTNAARRLLRQVFLEADIGISGVNFGVAETGTLCVVTNEGNGRMVTTLPRTHIALMGIERLLPTFDDLSLMLSLLPRSATGQKLSVYTNLLNSPRRKDDPDGPQERHIILVDNGRSAVRISPLKEILFCIRCGACLNACPVFREIGGHAYVGVNGESSPYPGPMGSIVSPALFGQPGFGQLARASSLCGACREACPVDIDLPKLLLRVRAGMATDQDHVSPRNNAPPVLRTGIKLFTLAATSPVRFALAQKVAGFLGSVASIFSRGGNWLHLPAFSGWGYSKDFHRPAGKPFHVRYARQITTPEDYEITRQDSINDKSSMDENIFPVSAQGDLLDTFANELGALGANYYTCDSGQVLPAILDILHARQINEILAWEEAHLPAGILAGLANAGIRITHPGVGTLEKDSLVKAGLSGMAAAVAETGSLLLPGGRGKSLTASLLPEVHIALVAESDILENLDQAFKREDIKHASAAVFITGPSRTADIEMTLTIGVHGPGELHVICIKNG